MQHGDAVAAEGSAGGVGVGAGNGKVVVAKVVAAAVADDGIDGISKLVFDGEVQHGNAVAAEGGAGGVGVCTGVGEGAAAKGITAAVADYGINSITEIILDGEVQHSNAVTTKGGAGGISVSASSGESAAAKGVAAAMTDYRMDGIFANRIDMDMHGEYTVGTGSRM